MEVNQEYTKQEILELHSNLHQEILPKSQQAYNSIKQLYLKDAKEYENLINQSNKTTNIFRQKQEQYSINLNQILSKKSKDIQFTTKGQGYLNAKLEEVKNKVKNIDSVSAGIKETVGKIKPLKLAKLPVSSQKILQKLFDTLFKVLYEEQNKKFEWEEFRKKGLEFEDGQDFIFRLVNVNFKELSTQKVNLLSEMKGDPQFDNQCINSKYSYDIIDLADWMEYVVVGHKFSEDKKACQKQYEKIRKDIDKRKKGTLEMSENFWREAIDQVQKFKNNIENFQSQIKGIAFGMNRSVQQIDESIDKRNKKIQQINAM